MGVWEYGSMRMDGLNFHTPILPYSHTLSVGLPAENPRHLFPDRCIADF
jgi:hypothetical protein